MQYTFYLLLIQVACRVGNHIGIMKSFGLVARQRTKMISWPTPTPPPSSLVLGPSNSLGCFKSFPFIRLTNFPPSFHPDFARDDDRDRLRLRRHRELGGVEEGRHDDDSPARPPRPRHGKGTRTGPELFVRTVRRQVYGAREGGGSMMG